MIQVLYYRDFCISKFLATKNSFKFETLKINMQRALLVCVSWYFLKLKKEDFFINSVCFFHEFKESPQQ